MDTERENTYRRLLQAGQITLSDCLKAIGTTAIAERDSEHTRDEFQWKETPMQRQFGEIREVANSTSVVTQTAKKCLKRVFPICNVCSEGGEGSQDLYIADQMIAMFVAGFKYYMQLNDSGIKIIDESQWHPTKEQMEVMQTAVMYFGDSWTSRKQSVLESLYNDLKKLYDGRDNRKGAV